MAQNEQTDGFNGLYFTFDSSKIKNIYFDFSFANVVVIKDEIFSIETRGTISGNFICHLEDDGTLIAKNERAIEQFSFTGHDRTRVFPRILITIPENFDFESLRIKMNAGRFSMEGLNIKCKVGSIKINAGELKIDSINGGEIDFSCGAGSLVYNGTVTGKTNVDCGMGSVILNIKGDIENYSCDSRAGLGAVKLNDTLLATFGHSYADKISDNHLSVNCGMGNVDINIHQY